MVGPKGALLVPVLLWALLAQHAVVPRAAVSAPAATAVTMVIGNSPESRRLVISPGGILTIRFDRGVSRVEAGDTELVRVSIGGPGFRDVVLRAQQRVGETQVHVWAQDMLVAFSVLVTRALPQTADFVLVRGRSVLPGPAQRGVQAFPDRQGAASVRARVEREGVSLDAEVTKRRSGLEVAYRLRNGSAAAYRLDPVRSVVWLDGKTVEFGIVRSSESADPMLLLPGAGESGVVMVPSSGKWLRLLLALYREDGRTPASPLWFDVTFLALDRLVIVGERR